MQNKIESAISAALNIAVESKRVEVRISEERITILSRIHKNDTGYHRAVQAWRGAMNYRERTAARRRLANYIPGALEILWLAVDARRLARPFNPIHFEEKAEQDLAR